jgi:hypothetical protein
VTPLHLLLLALLLAAPLVRAAPAESEADDAPAGEPRETPAVEEAPREPAPERNADRDARQDSPDVFVPTEQVSEDLSVSFPVDI